MCGYKKIFKNISIIIISALITSACVYDPVQYPPEETRKYTPRYKSRTLAKQLREYNAYPYGYYTPYYPQDNDAEYHHYYHSPSPYFGKKPRYGQPKPYYNQPRYPTYNPEADNQFYLPNKQPYYQPQPPYRPAPPPPPRNTYPQDNDAEYYYPLFLD